LFPFFTSKLGKLFEEQNNLVKAAKSSIPTKLEIPLLSTLKDVRLLIFAVVTTPSIGSESCPKLIKACSKAAFGKVEFERSFLC
jgi:hypothetical protein